MPIASEKKCDVLSRLLMTVKRKHADFSIMIMSAIQFRLRQFIDYVVYEHSFPCEHSLREMLIHISVTRGRKNAREKLFHFKHQHFWNFNLQLFLLIFKIYNAKFVEKMKDHYSSKCEIDEAWLLLIYVFFFANFLKQMIRTIGIFGVYDVIRHI